jgi:phosphotransferase system HPr-like phosphotransfer protein
MTLDGQHGDEMELRVWGPEAAAVVGDVVELVGNDFQ